MLIPGSVRGGGSTPAHPYRQQCRRVHAGLWEGDRDNGAIHGDNHRAPVSLDRRVRPWLELVALAVVHRESAGFSVFRPLGDIGETVADWLDL